MLLVLVAAVFSMAGWAAAYESGAKTATIEGVVTDASTGQPFWGALLTISGSVLSATSSHDGTYEISGIPAGSVTVSCWKSGYEAQTRSVVVVVGGTTAVDFKLSPGPEPVPAADRPGADLLERARRLHVMAQERKEESGEEEAVPIYMQAASAFEEYLEQFPESANFVEMLRRLADIQFFGVHDYARSAILFARMRDMDRKDNPYRQEAAELAMEARAKLVEQAAERNDPAVPILKKLFDPSRGTIIASIEVVDKRDPTARRKVTPVDIPQVVKDWIAEADRYVDMGWPGEDARGVTGRLRYLKAKVYLRYGHFDEARKILEELLKEYSDNKLLSVYCYTDIARTYRYENDLVNLETVSLRMQQESLGDTESVSDILSSIKDARLKARVPPGAMAPPPGRPPMHQPGIVGEGQVQHNTEGYDRFYENPFLAALENPLSTFSIDVDTASYANARRFINQSRLPPADAVRVEEFINYFTYDYPNPKGKTPFSITTEISTAPWNEDHRLIHIGLQGKKVDISKLPAQNLVFLLDVSGSMNSPNKLPLLKAAFKLLVAQLRPEDRVAIVVYAGAAGLVLPSTNGNEGDKIVAALDSLSAGGSTAGGAGIKLAYQTAIDNFIKGGNNRIILATDGDFNVGQSSDGELVRMIEEKREHGVFLTILGFGMGNYKDSKMEKLADKGNGNYGYIDSILEAKKMLVTEMGGTLLTIAKDVKIQVEFNPAKVKGYRLIGYENRMLRKEDFDDDKKDAGELGAGHTVTVLYEVIPAGSKEEIPGSGDLKYQDSKVSDAAKKSKELMTVKLRYKKPDGDKSKLIVQPLIDTDVALKKTSNNFRFSAAVAAFGLVLRDSKFKGDATFEDVIAMAKNAKGKDKEGYRYEFIKLVEKASLLKQTK